MTEEKDSLVFEARYYVLKARELNREGLRMIREADDMLELAHSTWARAKEVTE
jgi:hypothetical protein